MLTTFHKKFQMLTDVHVLTRENISPNGGLLSKITNNINKWVLPTQHRNQDFLNRSHSPIS